MGRSVSVSASPIKSVQSGYVNTSTVSTGTGEETRYLDVTISAVNVAKAVAHFVGAAGASVAHATSYNGANTIIPTCKVLNSTTVRIMCTSSVSPHNFVGRWSVVEYA